MTSTQRPSRRRTARHAFNEGTGDEGGEGNANGYGAASAKRTKVDGGGGGGDGGAKAGVGAQAKNTKKKSAAYDEDIDGFQFSRTRSKRIQAKEAAANAATAPARPVATEGTSTSDTGITVKVPSKRKKGSSAATATATATNENESTSSQAQPPRRRSARLSGDKETVAPITASTSAAVPIPHDSTETAKRTKQRPKSTSSSKEVEKEAGNRQPAGSPPLVNEIHIEKKRTATKIALPFADTPIIQRNKDMRKNSGQGHRRSSNGMRGRRASSLIEENKSNAVPHAEVETREFYKHIAQDLLEPKRMKQLLVWCGSRALPEKPSGNSEDASARMMARTIQEELLKELANNSDLSDVISKRDTSSAGLIKRPNPRNIQNANKLKELERELGRLKAQKREWDQLMLSSKFMSKAHPRSASRVITPNARKSNSITTDLSSIDSSLLSPSELEILNSLRSLHFQPLHQRGKQPSQFQSLLQPPTPVSNLLLQSSTHSNPSSISAINLPQQGSQPHSYQPPHLRNPSTTNTTKAPSSSSDNETHLVSQKQQPPPAVIPYHPLQHLHGIATKLEPTIDCLADGVHRLAQYKVAAERVAHNASVLASEALVAHDRRIKERSGTANVDVKDVLGALGSAIAEAEKQARGWNGRGGRGG